MEARTSFSELAGNEDGMQSGMPLFRSLGSASFLNLFVAAIVLGSRNWNVMRVNKPLVTRTQRLMNTGMVQRDFQNLRPPLPEGYGGKFRTQQDQIRCGFVTLIPTQLPTSCKTGRWQR